MLLRYKVKIYAVSQKNSQNCFWHNFVNFDNFWQKDGQDDMYVAYVAYVRCTHLPPHLIYVNALPCETQMFQIVTLHGDYLYQMAHLCIINLTEGAT